MGSSIDSKLHLQSLYYTQNSGFGVNLLFKQITDISFSERRTNWMLSNIACFSCSSYLKTRGKRSATFWADWAMTCFASCWFAGRTPNTKYLKWLSQTKHYKCISPWHNYGSLLLQMTDILLILWHDFTRARVWAQLQTHTYKILSDVVEVFSVFL